MKTIKNFIGSLIRDIIVVFLDYVYWRYEDGIYVYKSPFNFNISMGDYKFLKEKTFYEI